MLTYITTCRNDEQFLDTVEETVKYCDDPDFRAIIVDDYSTKPIYDIVSKWNDPRVSLYRITEDKGFNSHGARNLAMKVTTTTWNCLVDVDYRVVGLNNIIRMIKEDELEPNLAHFFPVAHTHEGRSVPHRESYNDFVVTTDLFWKVGGYDPEYIGLHTGDRDLLSRLTYKQQRKTNSLLYDVKLETLRSPYAIVRVDESISNPRSERFSEDRRYLYVSPQVDQEITHAEAAVIKRHKEGSYADPTPFNWEKQI